MLENVIEQRVDIELQTLIRVRAYQLYETRGRVEGLDREDWFKAEREVFRDLTHPADIAPISNTTKL
jgi:hypothetical protein